MSGTDILLANREMEEWRWLQLMNERLDAVLPLFKSYSLPRLEKVLEVRYWLGGSGPLAAGQVVRKSAKDSNPRFSNGEYSFNTRGIFMFEDVKTGIGNVAICHYWGLTMKGDWLLIDVHQGYQGTEPHAHATIVDVKRINIHTIEELKGAEAVCDLLDEAVQYWQQRYSKLFNVIEEFDEQRDLLEALTT